jgi:O-methyltransferase
MMERTSKVPLAGDRPPGLVDSWAPAQGMRWLRPLIPKRLQPYLRGVRKRYQRMSMTLDEPYQSVFPYTQVHPVRQRSLVSLCERIDRERVPGAVVECGVLDGGTAALMGWATNGSDPARAVHLFDAWEGLPETTREDGDEAAVWTGEVVGSPRRVLAIMEKLGVATSRLHVHRGWFDETFPSAHVPEVAIVHVDCDFYKATRLCLDKWYPLISPGGFLQCDDYAAFSGCRMAVDEFLAEHPEIRLETVGDDVKAYVVRKPT